MLLHAPLQYRGVSPSIRPRRPTSCAHSILSRHSHSVDLSIAPINAATSSHWPRQSSLLTARFHSNRIGLLRALKRRCAPLLVWQRTFQMHLQQKRTVLRCCLGRYCVGIVGGADEGWVSDCRKSPVLLRWREGVPHRPACSRCHLGIAEL